MELIIIKGKIATGKSTIAHFLFDFLTDRKKRKVYVINGDMTISNMRITYKAEKPNVIIIDGKVKKKVLKYLKKKANEIRVIEIKIVRRWFCDNQNNSKRC